MRSRINLKLMCRSSDGICVHLTLFSLRCRRDACGPGLAVACRTTRQNFGPLNVILAQQSFSLGKLLICSVLRTPFHVEDLILRSDKFLRIPMTAQTPL